MYFLFKMEIFHCYVCLPEGNHGIMDPTWSRNHVFPLHDPIHSAIFFWFHKTPFQGLLACNRQSGGRFRSDGNDFGLVDGSHEGKKKQPAGRKLYTLPLQETTYMTYYIILIPVYCVLLRFGFFFDMVTSVNIWSKLNQVTLGQWLIWCVSPKLSCQDPYIHIYILKNQPLEPFCWPCFQYGVRCIWCHIS